MAHDIADFEKMFNKLPNEYQSTCDKIRQKLQAKHS
jgi:hypothetical protein